VPHAATELGRCEGGLIVRGCQHPEQEGKLFAVQHGSELALIQDGNPKYVSLIQL
jgi:hypothetical protein